MPEPEQQPEVPPTVTIELIHTPTGKQKWRWRARATNNKIMATSAEKYTNRADCLTAIDTLFGPDTDVYLNEPDYGIQQLRLAKDWQ